MELILTKDVENLGFTDDLVNVKNGYGRNYLIPKGLAIMATSSAKKVRQETLKQRAFKENKLIEKAKIMADDIKALKLKLPVKSGIEGKLFGSVSNGDISNMIERNGFDIDKKYITISGGNIKRLGQYNIAIRLHREVNIQIDIDIISDNTGKK